MAEETKPVDPSEAKVLRARELLWEAANGDVGELYSKLQIFSAGMLAEFVCRFGDDDIHDESIMQDVIKTFEFNFRHKMKEARTQWPKKVIKLK